MNVQLKKAVATSYRADLLDAIEKAKRGKLPPSAQEYCFEEIEAEKGYGTYPEDGDDLFAQLRAALADTEQISEQQYEESELAEKGIKLLWFMSLDRYTFAEITYSAGTNRYDGRIYIDSYKHSADLTACADKLKERFAVWQSKAGISAEVTPYREPCDHCDGQFETLQQAANFVYTGICNPDKL